jgi:UDP-glucose 4-epimerase
VAAAKTLRRRLSAPVTIVEGDIRDRQLLKDVVEGIDIVFHQAAIRITQCAEEPRLAFDVLAGGTFDVLEASVRQGFKDRRRLVRLRAGSCRNISYDRRSSSLQQPHDLRRRKGFQRRSAAQFAEMYGLRYVALRYFNVYGPRMDVHGAYTEVLIRWMERIARACRRSSLATAPDHGFRPRTRYRPRQPARGEV